MEVDKVKVREVELMLPAHKAGLYLEHNAHKDYHLTVEKYEEQLAISFNVEYDPLLLWVSAEQRELAIRDNILWYIQWYPETPVGSCTLLAYDLATLLEAVQEGNKGV